MGPGKADLLDAIDRQGSISAAARAIGMSYGRAWPLVAGVNRRWGEVLVDVMNRCWGERLVDTAGGAGRSGARVTAYGHRVLGAYRTLQGRAFALRDGGDWEMLRGMLRSNPSPPNKR